MTRTKGRPTPPPESREPAFLAGIAEATLEAPEDATSPRSTGDAERPRFTIELAGDHLAQAMAQLVEEAQYWIRRGRYNKVRIRRNGKPLLPDIPVGALLAIEAATFFWTGLLRGALVNIAGKVLFEVELINDAKEHLAIGRKHFLDGDLDEAWREMEQALAIDDRDAEIHLAVGSLLKARGDRGGAVVHYRRAQGLDPNGATGADAAQQLEKLGVEV
ncbi:MAG: hypothetical protein JXR83_20090 [Deltaproteobacteria bacterium]|nr:hypothetical protein [Deltaproteobacteria bacterium]